MLAYDNDDKNDRDIFVGRKKEIKKFKEILRDVKKNKCRTVFITGEAGIGKTTFVNRLKPFDETLGFDFLSSKCQSEISDPYLPFIEAMQPYINKSQKEDSRMVFLGTDKPSKVDNEMFDAEKNYTFYKTTKFIKNIAENNPLLIFLDDLQWADRATLDILSYMNEKIDETPILFVGTYRPEEISDEHNLSNVLHKMNRRRGFDEIEIESLTYEQTEQIIKNIVNSENLPSEFIDILHKKTEGNPLFLKESIKHMLEHKIIIPKKNKYPIKIDEIPISDLTKNVIYHRLDRFDDRTKKVLEIGCVMGDSFSYELLSLSTKIDEIELLDVIDILIENGICKEKEDLETINFVNRMIRETIYEDMSSFKRKLFHQRIAGNIEDLYEGSLSNEYLNLAYHYMNAKKYKKAGNYYIKASERAKDVFAYEDAIDFYKKALDMSEYTEELDRVSILENIGDTYKMIGNHEEGINYFKKAIDIITNTDKKSDVYREISDMYEKKGKYSKALESCEEGLNLIDDQETTVFEKLIYKRSWILMRKGDYDEAIEGLQNALKIAEDIEDKKGLSDIYHGLGTTLWHKDMLKEALNNFNKGLSIRKELNDLIGQCSSYNNIGLLHHEKGELDKALEKIKQSYKLSKKVNYKSMIATSLSNIGLIYIDKGEFDQAYERLQKSLETFKKTDELWGIATVYDNLGYTFLYKNKLDKSNNYFKQSLEINKDINHKYFQVYNHVGLAENNLKRNKHGEALKNGKKALDISIDINANSEKIMAHRVLGTVYREKGEKNNAKDEFEKGKRIAEKGYKNKSLARLLREYGLLYKSEGEAKKAKNMLNKALGLYEEMGMNYWLKKCKNDLDNF